MQSTEDIYRTSDTALAAYLISEGLEFPEIEYENSHRAYFIFPFDRDIETKISDFDTARAIGNIVLFFNAYQGLLRRIKR